MCEKNPGGSKLCFWYYFEGSVYIEIVGGMVWFPTMDMRMKILFSKDGFGQTARVKPDHYENVWFLLIDEKNKNFRNRNGNRAGVG